MDPPMGITNVWEDIDEEVLEACEKFTAAIEAEKKVPKAKKAEAPKRKYIRKDESLLLDNQIKDYQERVRLSTGIKVSYRQARIKVQQIVANEKRRREMITQNRLNYPKIDPVMLYKYSFEDFDSDSETVALDN